MTMKKLALILFAVCVVLALIFRKKPIDTYTTTNTSTATTSQRRTSTDEAIVNFRTKLNQIEPKLFLAVERTPVEGVARVQVSNVWYASQPYQRRQLTQMMANLWESEMQGETAILHVYDITGHEIAGTKALGGVWMEE